MSRHLRVAIVAAARYPIKEPFAGGLEAHTWELARALTRRGHEITVFAAPGSDPTLGVRYLDLAAFEPSASARADVSMCPDQWLADHHAYLSLMLDLAAEPARFDVVHNNCLHYLPIAMSPALRIPMVTTLHCPPTPWLESAIRATDTCPVTFAAVSRHTARVWSHLVEAPWVIRNGVDLGEWVPGAGGSGLFWSGRIVPEKGTHLAIDAARIAGRPLQVAGPVSDRDYFERMVRPRLGGSVTYLGHLPRHELVRRIGAADATLVTPCWDEPYGLVVAESLACGTPVAGFEIGALPELVDDTCARLAQPGDVTALAEAIPAVTALSRAAARRRAEVDWSHDRMVSEYLELYRDLVP